MSAGITPKDFVQQAFYQQEKVLLDFYPTDDKYREVLMDGNYVLQELQKDEDWLWLRDTIGIGYTEYPRTGHEIASFKFDTSKVYKLSSLFGDCVHLCSWDIYYPGIEEWDPAAKDILKKAIKEYIPKKLYHIEVNEHDSTISYSIMITQQGFVNFTYDGNQYLIEKPISDIKIDYDMWNKIDVPLISAGTHGRNLKDEVSRFGKPNWLSRPLGCYVLDDKLCFNRPFLPFECERAVVIDYQKRIDQFHICDYECGDDDLHVKEESNKIMLKYIPDINYVVMKTAATHAIGSPTAQGNIASLTDTAQKLLSAMRENNAMATTCDTMEWYTPGFIEVV